MKAQVIEIKLSNLYLDPNNYRLINDKRYSHVDENNITDELIQKRTLGILCGTKNEHIKDLIDSFRTNGYLPVDQIQVRKLSEDKYLVLEGNRRTAALKTLKEEYEIDSIDLGQFDKLFFDIIPVVLYDGNESELQHLIVMGLKHISGNKKWGEWNQAQLIKKLSDSGKNEDELCYSIGIDKTALRRNLRALALIEQYKASDYGDQFSETMFPVFREIIASPAIKNWIGWIEYDYLAENVKNTERLFALLSKDTRYDDSDSEHTYPIEPAITKREEVRTFAQFVDDEKALLKLEKERNIATAYNASKAGIREQVIQPQNKLVEEFDNNVETIMQMQLEQGNYTNIQSQVNRLQSFLDKKSDNTTKSVNEEVFYNRIEKHFSKLIITDYKLFKKISAEHLKRINIFAGENNSGKTTVLEALYLLCKQNNFSGIHEIIRRRGKTSDAKMDSVWFWEQIPEKLYIEGIFDTNNSDLHLKKIREDSGEFDSTGYLGTIQIESVYENQKQESSIRLFDARPRETHSDASKILCPVVFSSPFFFNEPYRYSEFYYKSVKSKNIPTILSFIRKYILPKVTDIRMVDDLQRFLVSDDTFSHAVDITSYGEGVQRIFFISLLFASAENGVLLLDEFENAIHVELLSKFTRFIEEMAKFFNVQVFITSHSKECIDAFVTNIDNLSDLSYYSLRKKDTNILVRYFSGMEFKRLLLSGNTDLRTIK